MGGEVRLESRTCYVCVYWCVCVCYEQVCCVNLELVLQLWLMLEDLCASESESVCVIGCYTVNGFVSGVKADLSLRAV